MIDLFLCDDHEIFRNGLKSTLSGIENLGSITECKNGLECMNALTEKQPHVIFLDINMPVMDGIETLKAIRKKYGETIKIIALTQYNEKRFVKQMMKWGANGYVLKTTTKQELSLAIQTVLNNEEYLSDEPQKVINKEEVTPNALFPELSTREKEIIQLLCEEYSTKQIADDLNISFHTVESHRSNIMKKLNVNNVAGIVRWAVANDFDKI